MRPIIKPRDKMRKGKHKKQGDIPEHILEKLERAQHRAEQEAERRPKKRK